MPVSMGEPCYCILLRKAGRNVTAIYDEALAPTGVNIAQFSLMRRIARTEPVSLTELARAADLDRSTVGRNARVLERRKLVKSARGEDQREAMLSLTARGGQVLKQGAPLWDKAQAKIAKALGDLGLAQLEALAETA